MEDRGNNVTGYKEDGDIIFKVKDNGVGMTKIKLIGFLRKIKKRKGFQQYRHNEC